MRLPESVLSWALKKLSVGRLGSSSVPRMDCIHDKVEVGY